MNKNVWIAGVVLFFISLSLRMWSLGYVHQVVFDEVHFGKFISSYCCTHQRFFDIHPPIGKLLIAGGAYISGYSGTFPFEFIGQPYGVTPIAAIRFVPALFGALIPICAMVLLRQAGVSLPFAWVGGFALALDNALIVESRFILTDSMLLAGIFGALVFGVAAIQSSKDYKSWMFAIMAGICSGIAVGTKFTGMVGGMLVAATFLYAAWRDGKTVWIVRLVGAGLVAILLYTTGWYLHFALLTQPGSGDIWGIPTGNFVHDVIVEHQRMLSANYHLTATHPYGSAWWSWPFMIRSVFYWQGETSSAVYLLGNPVVWWAGAYLFISSLIFLGKQFRARTLRSISIVVWLVLFGYLASYVPLMRVPRVLFLYHYLTPLICSIILGIWWLDHIAARKKMVIACIVAICIVLGFVWISPVTYGFPTSQLYRDALFTISTWR